MKINTKLINRLRCNRKDCSFLLNDGRNAIDTKTFGRLGMQSINPPLEPLREASRVALCNHNPRHGIGDNIKFV
jgi:hypothetical protein